MGFSKGFWALLLAPRDFRLLHGLWRTTFYRLNRGVHTSHPMCAHGDPHWSADAVLQRPPERPPRSTLYHKGHTRYKFAMKGEQCAYNHDCTTHSLLIGVPGRAADDAERA